jgi:hypothetical protein
MSDRRTLRWLALAPLVALASVASVGCATTSDSELGAGDDAVTEVAHSSVKDQSTENCWIYATTGWVESLHLAATGEEKNLSESYLTYWAWFEHITHGGLDGGVVEEGGSWGEAGDLILKYGMMNEKDFISSEADEIFSKRQEKAVNEVNAALKSGALRTAAARRDPARVRDVLDGAFKIKTTSAKVLDTVFGHGAPLTLDKEYAEKPLPDGAPIYKATDLKAKLTNPDTGRLVDRTVADAIGTHKSADNLEHRNGSLSWQDATLPKANSARRDFWKRVERALNDHMPILINWTVDFSALTKDGKFLDVPAKPGSQGGHMVLGYDYAVDNVPGFGSLEAGVDASKAALDAALDDAAEVRFIRVKNSWSPTYHQLPAPAPGGYHDLYVKYLTTPMKICDDDAKDNPIMSTCVTGTALESIVLPAGY